MTHERTFPPSPDSVREARSYVLAQLPTLPRATLDRISLVVSELATNAVVHAATEFTVRLKLSPATLTLEVTDGSDADATPADEPPPADQPHGRGLLIATRLAAVWGVISDPAVAGKTVWVELALDAVGDHQVAHGAESVGEPLPMTIAARQAQPAAIDPLVQPAAPDGGAPSAVGFGVRRRRARPPYPWLLRARLAAPLRSPTSGLSSYVHHYPTSGRRKRSPAISIRSRRARSGRAG